MRFLSIAIMALLVASGLCQVRPVLSSVESYAASAKVICVGKIAKIEDVKVDSWEAIELTIEVTETLKGRAARTITAQRDRRWDKARFEAAWKAGADFVWFVPKDTARNEFCLEIDHSDYRKLGGLAIGMDFTVLSSRQKLLGRIRRFLKENPGANGGAALLTPVPGQSLTGWVDFLIPLCPWAGKLAVRMITKPDSFAFGTPTGNPYDPASEPIWLKSKEGMLRAEGLILLQHFPSASNIRLAKRCLNDGSIAMKQSHGKPITTYYWVRDAAFRLLSRWNVDVERPLIDGPPMEYRQGLFTTDGGRIAGAFRQ